MVCLNAHTVSINVIQLTWQAPAVHVKCISNYSIVQCVGKSCNEIAVSVTNYTVNNLEPCTEYQFTVKTVTASVESIGINKTARTASPSKNLAFEIGGKMERFCEIYDQFVSAKLKIILSSSTARRLSL